MRKYKEIKEKLWEYRTNLTGDLDTRNTQEIIGWSKASEKDVCLTNKKAKRYDIEIADLATETEIHVYVNFGSKFSNKYTEDIPSDNFIAYIHTDGRIVLESQLDQIDINSFKLGNINDIDFTKYL